jgi:hypothetical protein
MRATETTKFRTMLLCAAVLAAGACTARPPAGGGGSVPPAPSDGDGTRFGQVVPGGEGCAGNSTNTSVSSDGLVFTTTFSAFTVQVNPGQTGAYRDCNFTIRVHTPSGRSVSLQSFYYSAFASLEPGVRADVQTAYWFDGSPVTPRSGSNRTVVGPVNDEFIVTDEVPVNATDWTPCGTDHVLNIASRITLQSSSAASSGYMNISSLDGSSKVESRVDSRPCTPGT